MNTYHAFYKGSKIELEAKDMYAANIEAAKLFKTKPTERWKISVLLAAMGTGKDAVPYIHSTASI